jgi:murein DD-endopeptidase MepM/ murein hydrolase activator NlpD
MRAPLRNTEKLRRIALMALCLFAPIILAGCVTREDAMTETHHDWPLIVTVHDGDTVSQIADRYNTSTDAICDENDIAPGSTIYPGQKLRVPGRESAWHETHPANNYSTGDHSYTSGHSDHVETRPLPPVASQTHSHPRQQYASNQPVLNNGDDLPVANGNVHFGTPVGGRVIANFGSYGNGQRNDGINIAAAFGTPVHVSADGVVTYSGNELKGYGNLILVKHANGYVTTYAHLGTIGVQAGQSVGRGDVIGSVGQTGDVQSPQLHFEIRRPDMSPVDPRPLLMASRE